MGPCKCVGQVYCGRAARSSKPSGCDSARSCSHGYMNSTLCTSARFSIEEDFDVMFSARPVVRGSCKGAVVKVIGCYGKTDVEAICPHPINHHSWWSPIIECGWWGTGLVDVKDKLFYIMRLENFWWKPWEPEVHHPYHHQVTVTTDQGLWHLAGVACSAIERLVLKTEPPYCIHHQTNAMDSGYQGWHIQCFQIKCGASLTVGTNIKGTIPQQTAEECYLIQSNT